MQSVRSGFQLNLGLMSVPVNLYSVIPSDTGRKMRNLCATHKVPIKQAYLCPEDQELNPPIVKGFEVRKNQFSILDDADVASIEFLADDGMDLVAVPTESLDNHTVPGSTLYYAQPHQTAVKAWEIIFRLTQDRKRTLVGQTALRANSRKLYRLTVFNDYLVLQEVRFPEQVREAPERPTVTIEKRLMDQAKSVLDAIEVDWSKYDANDEMLAKFRSLVEQGETVVTATSEGDTPNVTDLMEALQASVAATKKRAKK